MQTELVINVHDLLHRPNSRKEVVRDLVSQGYSVSAARVPEGAPISVDFTVESLSNAGTVRVTGTISTRYIGECRRCLGLVEGVLQIDVDELFSRTDMTAIDEYVWPLDGDEINITEVVRENIFLALPLSPLCENACRGPVPQEYPTLLADEGTPEATSDNEEPARDPRWAGLDALHFD